ncbi:hypothetical protein AA313_de0204746 [Arthrobotrys entomopaga]|nr:hypothetical protein AA313_de0204746 [Arthrobotrys entomopaga]
MGVLLVGFFLVQVFLPKTATLPMRILKQRSVVAGFWMTLCIGSSNYIFIYFLPLWFQSIKGVSAVDSGIRLLPLMLSIVLGSLIGGATTSKIGYYTPWAIFGSILLSVGAGLLTTLQADGTSAAKWIGYQIVYGLGMGVSFQTPNLAVQTVLPKPDIPIGLSFMFFGQLAGAAIFVAVGENILGNQLVRRLSNIPGFNKSLVVNGGATALLGSVPAEFRHTVLVGYNEALRNVFQVGLVLCCLTILGAVGLEWRSILKKPQENTGGEKGQVTEEKKIGMNEE